MKQHEARAFIPLLQAWADGAELEMILPGGKSWGKVVETGFSKPPSHYRIRPITRREALGPQDFPPGTVLSRIDEVGWLTITEVFENGVWAAGTMYGYGELASNDKRRLLPGADPATGWLPCYREFTEEQPAPSKPAEHLPLPAGHTYHNPSNVTPDQIPAGWRMTVVAEMDNRWSAHAQIRMPLGWSNPPLPYLYLDLGKTYIVPLDKCPFPPPIIPPHLQPHNPDNVPADKVPEGYRFAVKGEVNGEFWRGAQWWQRSLRSWHAGGCYIKNDGFTYIVPTSKPLPPDEAP